MCNVSKRLFVCLFCIHRQATAKHRNSSLQPQSICSTSFLTIVTTYGVLPTGLLTFLGSLYNNNKSRENYFRNFGVSLRETNRQKKNSSFQKHCVRDLECKILSQEPSDSFILYFNVIFRGK